MARPVEFDRSDVVDGAIRVFARHGFAAASMTELLDGMGINRQSLYGAFGDKRRLFLEALKTYSDSSIARMTAALSEGDSVLAGLEAALRLDLGSGSDVETGCLGVGSIAEFGRSDPDINALSDQAGLAAIAAFSSRVREGIATGELRQDLDATVTGTMLLTLKSGLKVAARGGASEDVLRDSVRLVLSGLAA